MDKVIKGHNEHFSRLEGVSNLSKIYDAFIVEILRRKRFTASYESMVEKAREEIMEFRREETTHRESFIHKYGATLPQLFFSVVNSLNEKPPFCEITLTDKQWLPDIEVVDLSPNEASRLVHPDTFYSMEKSEASVECTNVQETNIDSEYRTRIDHLESENERLRSEGSHNSAQLEIEHLKRELKAANEVLTDTNAVVEGLELELEKVRAELATARLELTKAEHHRDTHEEEASREQLAVKATGGMEPLPSEEGERYSISQSQFESNPELSFSYASSMSALTSIGNMIQNHAIMGYASVQQLMPVSDDESLATSVIDQVDAFVKASKAQIDDLSGQLEVKILSRQNTLNKLKH